MKMQSLTKYFNWGSSNQGISTKPYKSGIWIYLLGVTFYLWMVLNTAYDDYKHQIQLPVIVHTAQLGKINQFQLPNHNSFSSGDRGILTWNPRSFKEALILDTVNEGGLDGIDIFHVTLFFLYVIAFYLMMRGSGKNLVFSNKIYYGFLFIVFMIAISGLLESYKSRFVSQYIQNITNGQFKLQPAYFPKMYYYVVGMMLFFILKYPQKAIELQKDQDLTI
jgi:hypothetical protein